MHTVKDVAKLLKCSSGHARQLIASGKLKGVNMAMGSQRHNWRVSEDALGEYLKSAAEESTAPRFRIPPPQRVDVEQLLDSARQSVGARSSISSRRPSKPERPTLKLNLANLHSVVADAARAYSEADPGWDGTYGEHGGPALKLRVSPTLLERAVLLADKLYKACEIRGFKVGSPGKEGSKADIVVDGEPVRVVIKEKLAQSENTDEKRDWRWRRRKFTPSGKLLITIGEGYSSRPLCGDSTRWKAEDRIDKAIEKIVEAARDAKKSRIRWEREKKESEKQWRRELEAQMRREKEEKKASAFMEHVAVWNKATSIRAFVKGVRDAAAARRQEIELGSPLDIKLRWALEYADKVDPIPRLLRSSAKQNDGVGLGDSDSPQDEPGSYDEPPFIEDATDSTDE